MSNDTSLTTLTENIINFRDQRRWKQFHNPKDMVISLSLEVSELLELTQWKSGEELVSHLATHHKAVGEELSDILYWTLLIAHDLQINLVDAFKEKMILNDQKYPVEKARDSSEKYTEFVSE